MKTYKILKSASIVTFLFFIDACTYDFPTPDQPTSGNADFTKVAVIGNSVMAGLMNGALYDAGQQNSVGAILGRQIVAFQGGGNFNQPDIASPLGNFGTASGIPGVPDGIPLGRLRLVGLASPAPQPIIPGDLFNTSCNCPDLNNFSVPGMRLIHADFPGYGSPLGNPYFARFASSPIATVIDDAANSDATFFAFWLGNNDVLGYAMGGGAGSENGTESGDMTPAAVFDALYGPTVDKMMNNGAKGILANVPEVSDLPFFKTISWDAIELDTITAGFINPAYVPYNQGLAAAVLFKIITQEEADLRKIAFIEGGTTNATEANGIVIVDSTLTDVAALSGGAIPIPMIRQTNISDLVALSAGAELGQRANPADPTSVIGVGVPLGFNGNDYILTTTDQGVISDRIAAFNATIKSKADGSTDLILFDAHSFYANFAENGASINGSGLTSSIVPPFAAFSVDGIHPNPRGSAYLANQFVEAINKGFNSTLNTVNPNDYVGNELPVP